MKKKQNSQEQESDHHPSDQKDPKCIVQLFSRLVRFDDSTPREKDSSVGHPESTVRRERCKKRHRSATENTEKARIAETGKQRLFAKEPRAEKGIIKLNHGA